jgi:hypothetical protein
MPRVYVNQYKIPWILPSLAVHMRVMIGTREWYFINNDEHPQTVLRVFKSRKILSSLKIGKVDTQIVDQSLRRVNSQFPPGTYNVAFNNCSHYAYRLCCALFGQGHTNEMFPSKLSDAVRSTLTLLPLLWNKYTHPHPDNVWPNIVQKIRVHQAVNTIVEAAVPNVD